MLDTDDVEIRMHNPVVSRTDSGFAAFQAIANVASSYEAGGQLFLGRTRGTKLTPTAVISGDRIGDLVFYGNNGTIPVAAARLSVTTAEDWDATANGSKFEFYTTDINANSQRLRGTIEPGGNLSWYTSIVMRVDSENSGSIGAGFIGFTSKDDNSSTVALYRSRGSMSLPTGVASGDTIGSVDFNGHINTGSTYRNAAFIDVVATQAFGVSDTGVQMMFAACLSGGTSTTILQTLNDDGGATFGSPSGGSKGFGTVNAEAVYDDGALLTCYPLEYARTGDIDVEQWDRRVPKRRPVRRRRKTEDGRLERNEQARAFRSRAEMLLDPEQYANFWQTNGHLPAFPSVESWQALSLGDISQRMWETVETQAVHIAKLTARINSLEGRGVRRS